MTASRAQMGMGEAPDVWQSPAGHKADELKRELALWRAKQPSLDELADILGVCEGVCPLHAAIFRLRYLQDLPLCRRQLPDGSVPGNTEEALEAWVRTADNALREVERERQRSLVIGNEAAKQAFENARLTSEVNDLRGKLALAEARAADGVLARKRVAELEADLGACMAGGRYVRAENDRLRRVLEMGFRDVPLDWRPGCGHGRFFRVGFSDQVYCTDCQDFRPDPTAPGEAVEGREVEG